MTSVLIVDDEESICWGLSQLCSKLGFESEIAATAEQGIELAKAKPFDLVILDVRLPGMDGISAIPVFREHCRQAPIITVTAFGDLTTAIEAVKQGAFEYIVKPFDLENVSAKIVQAIAVNKIAGNDSPPAAVDSASNADSKHELIGSSPLMQVVFKQIALTTTSDAPVLITGESGTGKELTARSIHKFGGRSTGPFVAVNIAALSQTLVESELFGHTKGAFTGADVDRMGLLQQANGGTLFLDEIAEIPVSIQVKLLRALDTNEITPVGSNTPIQTDFRLVTATHQNLLEQINHGDFRLDLFYRIRTFEIKLPALRERKEDIPELVSYFLNQFKSNDRKAASESFLKKLQTKQWYGNVRELRSEVERAAAIARGPVLTEDHASTEPELAGATAATSDAVKRIQEWVAEWTRQKWEDESNNQLYENLIGDLEPALLVTAFELSNHQFSAASRRLGIHRTTLKKKLDAINAQIDR